MSKKSRPWTRQKRARIRQRTVEYVPTGVTREWIEDVARLSVYRLLTVKFYRRTLDKCMEMRWP